MDTSERQMAAQHRQDKHQAQSEKRVRQSMGPSLDESLMNMRTVDPGLDDNDPGSWASSLRQQKQLNRSPEAESESSNDEGDDLDDLNDPGSIMKNLRSLKKAAKEQNKQLAKGRLSEAGKRASTIRQATSRLLQNAWKQMFSNWVAGPFALAWIHIHVFLRFVVGEDKFCKLGQEWFDGKSVAGAAATGGPGGAGTQAAKSCFISKSCLPNAEVIALVLIDIIHIVAIMFVATVILLLIDIATNTLDWIWRFIT